MTRYWPLLLFPLVAAVAAVLTVPLFPHGRDAATFEVRAGQPLRALLRQAADDGIVRAARPIEWLARLGGFDRPKIGRYNVPDRGSDLDFARMLHAGRVATVPVTVPEGWTATEIGAALEAASITGRRAFLRAVTDTTMLARFGIPATEAEGYLFPETYRFAAGVSATDVVAAMVQTFQDRLPADFAAAASAVGLSPHDAVILASVVQRESFRPDEMPEVAGVFHNRLQRGMRLEADPTAIYRMPGYDGNLTRRHLRTRTPYNTYVIRGLPAGPISNPGTDALRAAVQPATTDALFFVARPDGTHIFARDYRTHQQNVHRTQILRRP